MLVNRTVYCTLALFFGWIGIHKLYVKKYKAALMYFLFCWTFIPFILSIIEAFFAFICPVIKERNKIFIP